MAKRTRCWVYGLVVVLAGLVLGSSALLLGYGIHTKKVELESETIECWRRALPHWGLWKRRILDIEIDERKPPSWSEGQEIGLGPLRMIVWGPRIAGRPPERERKPGSGIVTDCGFR